MVKFTASLPFALTLNGKSVLTGSACELVCMQFVTMSASYAQLKAGEDEQVVVDVVLQSLQQQSATSCRSEAPFRLHTLDKKPQRCNYLSSLLPLLQLHAHSEKGGEVIKCLAALHDLWCNFRSFYM